MYVMGWIISVLISLFLVGASAAPKFLGASAATDAMTSIGWSPRYLIPIGVAEATLAVLYLIPRTSLVAAILLTGLLGGAMASHIRAESPLWSHTLFSIYLGAFMWAGLLLRDTNLQAYFER